jgi:ubiquinone/menaquinone biosynthesis C-methylase UbiE
MHEAEKPATEEQDPEERAELVVDRYEKEAAEYDSETYGSERKQLFSRIQCEELEELMDATPDMKILDVGSGTGRFLKFFGSKGYDIYGVEPAQEMIRVTKKKIKGVTVKQGDIENILYPDEKFDRIITMHVLMHLHPETISKGIEEMMRVLKPGGFMLLDFPHEEGIWNRVGRILFPNPTRTRSYSKEEVRGFAKDYPYEITGIFSFPRLQYHIRSLRGISYWLERKLALPLMFRSQLILKICKPEVKD